MPLPPQTSFPTPPTNHNSSILHTKFPYPFYDALSLFIVALIRFGAVGVSSPAAESSSLCAADAVFRFTDFLRAVALVGEGLGSSNAVLSGITFCHQHASMQVCPKTYGVYKG